MKRRLLTLVAVLSAYFAAARTGQPYNLTAITTEDGLASNMVDDIFKDSHGFVWIATWGGLERYDGYEFKTYTTRDHAVPLRSNFVRAVNEDKWGRLWVASDGGVDVIDLHTGKQIIFDTSGISNVGLFRQPAESVFIDSYGTVWITSDKYLAYVTAGEDGELKSIGSLFDDVELNSGIVAVSEVNNTLWAGVDNRVYRIIHNNGSYSPVPASERLVLDEVERINAIFQDNSTVWIGTDYGLFNYDIARGNIRRYMTDPDDNNSISQNFITDIVKDPDGNILISTLNGLNIYDRHTDSFERMVSSGFDEPNSLNCNFINCMYVDGSGMIWLGTEKGGINKMIRKRLIFRNIVHVPGDRSSLPPNPVNAIFEDSYGNLWVGSVEGGLNRKIRGSDSFRRFTGTAANQSTISHNSVSYITEDDRGNLWVGTWGGGINKVANPNGGDISFRRMSQVEYPDLISNYIAAMVWDSKNKGIWTGTPAGLSFFDIHKDNFHTINLGRGNERIRTVGAMLLDRTNRLWIASSAELYCVYLDRSDIKEQKYDFKCFDTSAAVTDSMLMDRINCIVQGRDGTIWIGSMGGGLYKVIEREGGFKFVNYLSDTGISDNSIYGIVEDDSGNLWLSTNNGLSMFNPITGRGKGYFKSDGLLNNQFYWNAYWKGRDGQIYFGNMTGLVSLDSQSVIPDTSQSHVILTRMRILNDDVTPFTDSRISRAIEETKSISLHESDKSFSIEFSSLNYENPSKIRYAYRLAGFDDKWTEVDANRRFASYTNLKAGHYVFEVKATDLDGNWTDQTTKLGIKVSPYFYKSWWFMMIVAIACVTAAYSYYRYRLRSLERHRNLLKKIVHERTLEIQEQKAELEKQAVELNISLGNLMTQQKEITRQNEMLTLQNQKITRQKEQLITMSKKVQELHVDKISFFTNITHELRTPITLISGPVERALKLTDDPKVAGQLKLAQRNSQSLLSIVNQLMDFRKVDSQKMKVVKSLGNFADFLDSLLPSFEEYAGERNIAIRKKYNLRNPVMMFDEDNMQKVINNLLANAIKFTPENGEIALIVTNYHDKAEDGEQLCIIVKDNGPGIPADELEHIFERFYQSKNTSRVSLRGQSGTGIGLYLCRRIVELLGGTIKAANNSGGGASFRITIPIDRAADARTAEQKSFGAGTEPGPGLPQAGIELPKFDQNRPLILVIDDSSDMRQYISSILSEQYNVVEADNGRKGLEILSLCQPNIIISDIMMPVMDGLEFCRQVKGNFQTSHIPVVLLTAKTSDETRIESYSTGADAFITKPFNEEVMLTRIRNLIEQRTKMQEKFTYHMDPDELGISDDSQDKKFMAKAIEVVKNNYTDPEFDVTQFIEEMGMSRSLLHKKLQNLAGQTANRFIRIYRLNVSRELIVRNTENKNMNISEIAYEVGFNDPKYFTRCFTKHFGYPPSAIFEGKEV